MVISCLEDLSVLLKMKNWFRLVTCCAAIFLRGRYQILYSLIFQRPHFKKFSGYLFENIGGVFCSSCRRVSIPAMTGSRGPSDCIDCEVATEFRLPITLEQSTWARLCRPRSSTPAFADVVSRQVLPGHKTSTARAQTVPALPVIMRRVVGNVRFWKFRGCDVSTGSVWCPSLAIPSLGMDGGQLGNDGFSLE